MFQHCSLGTSAENCLQHNRQYHQTQTAEDCRSESVDIENDHTQLRGCSARSSSKTMEHSSFDHEEPLRTDTMAVGTIRWSSQVGIVSHPYQIRGHPRVRIKKRTRHRTRHSRRIMIPQRKNIRSLPASVGPSTHSLRPFATPFFPRNRVGVPRMIPHTYFHISYRRLHTSTSSAYRTGDIQITDSRKMVYRISSLSGVRSYPDKKYPTHTFAQRDRTARSTATGYG